MSDKIKTSELEDIQVLSSEDFYSKDARTTSVKGFHLLKKIESGGFGIVFLGKHKDNDLLFAIKIVNKWKLVKPIFQESVKRELRIHKELDHPFIIKMMAAFQTPTRICMVLELASQDSMAELPEILPKEDIKYWLAEVWQGLHFLHGKSIVHRDIKNENILLAADGHVKIGDFGFAKDGMEKDTKAFEVVGTAFSMSPEIFKRAGYTRATDIWAFGVLALELITNENLYGTADQNEIASILKKMQSCDQLEFPKNLRGKKLDFVKGMLQFEENRMSLNEVRAHRFFSGVKWDALLDYTFEGAPYHLPEKKDCNKPIILEEPTVAVSLVFDDFEFSNL
ncbi:hypothetical protein CRE_14825 [Caenorhabditis remanei]|uniref:Protein kinase domain-containing protein n=1 Tax=Caenorhabditis remanei TaxID=31234 RepID=E3MRW5_CAERE|nr:hypothetical protein CRE_14825 [Caenorhabditis remanei]